MAETATMAIPKDIIEPIVSARISAILVEMFGDKEELIQRIVNTTLTQKVDSEGKLATYHRDGNLTVVEYEARQAIRAAVKAALEEVCAQHKERITASLVRELTARKGSPLLRQLAEGIVTGMCEATKSQWRLKVAYGEE